ncbi:MAG: hypothetical protein LBQ93_03765 [Treponema sp.]|jgi:hypothetical protein|nr:hypothetical protein [Treponema sp.]
MAVLIQEPNDNNPLTEDWQKFLARTTFQGGGFINLFLNGLNTSEEPAITNGSRLEANGSFYAVTEDEAIEDPNNAEDENWVFVYAVPRGETLQFIYDTIMPVYDVMKGGWYNGAARAVAKMFKQSDGLWCGKVILKDYESMFVDNINNIPEQGGVEILTGDTNGVILELEPGVYCYEMRSGQSGKGGNGYGGGTPETPAEPDETNGSFCLTRKTLVCAIAGKGGGNGSNGTEAGNRLRTGGGSGAVGGLSVIWLEGRTITSPPPELPTAGSNASGGYGNGQGAPAPAFIPAVLTQPMQAASQISGRTAANVSYVYGDYNEYTGYVQGGTGGGHDPARDGFCRIKKIMNAITPEDFT